MRSLRAKARGPGYAFAANPAPSTPRGVMSLRQRRLYALAFT